MKHAVAPAVAVVVTALAVAGCGLSFGRHSEVRTYTAPADVTALSVKAGTRRVEIVASDAPGIEVREKLSWSNGHNKPNPKHDVAGGRLSLSAHCATQVIGSNACGIAYRVRVPRALAVEVDSGDGAVTVTGAAGALRLKADTGSITASDLRTSSLTASTGDGSLRVSGAAGTADLRTGSGSITMTNLVAQRLSARSDDGSIRLTGRAASAQLRSRTGTIEAEGLAADHVLARTGEGRVRLGLTTAPRDVRVDTSVGGVRVRLPRGEGYAIEVASRTGHERVDKALHHDSRSPRRVQITTGDGDITVMPA